MKEILEVDRLRVSFQTPQGEVRAVDKVSFGLKEEEMLAIIGETGCGKSTLARAILKLLGENASIEGKILYKGENLLELDEKGLAGIRGKFISIILQNPDLALNPVLTIEQQLLEMVRIHNKIKKDQARGKVKKILEKMGFSDSRALLKKYPFQLSGGMVQRVLIAAAMLNSPDIIIADEPSRALDRKLRTSIVNELIEIKKMDSTAILLVTHDLDLAVNFSDRVVVMYAGELVEICDTKQFFEKPLHPYSQALSGSLPGKGFQPITGMTPSLIKPPAGCRFHPRCKFRKDICLVRKPELISIEEGQVRCILFT